uniref:HIG1 domain-containing protein n=1 Tax=Panagrolaimus superbus TaxID=310955 RepID=A0A914Z3J0_9BILA
MSDTNAAPSSDFMTWRVEDHSNEKPQQKARRNFSEVVPMIPSDLMGGSERSNLMNPLVRSALTNPLVPVGMVATVGCLIGMCKATLNRNMYRAQLYMRGRVAAQFFTVCVLVGGALYLGFKPPPGFGGQPGVIPATEDSLTKRMLNRNTK